MHIQKFVFLPVIFCLALSIGFSQEKQQYDALVAEAMALYNTENFRHSGEKFSEAFKLLGGKGVVSDRYNAACSWALASEKDSAFVHLFKIAQNGSYTNYNHIVKDKDLSLLHSDQRWDEVLELVKANKERAEEHLDKPLVAELDSIRESDQKYRHQLNEVIEKHGWESDETQRLFGKMHVQDSINLVRIKKILDERGWLGPDVVGPRGNSTLFLVIQHANLETQEKYLPMMREAVAKGNASASSLALLEDRVALGQGKRQIYGSQIGHNKETAESYVLPLQDPDNVDARRAKVGLGPLAHYISRWGLVWDVEEYKKKLPELEAKRKN